MMLSRTIFGFVLIAATVGAQTAPATKSAAATRRPAAKAARTQSVPAVSNPKQDEKKAAPAARRRDPFLSIIQTRTAATPNCAAGRKCLVINQVVLKGVAQSPDGMLALVENGQHKSYFLREKDPVFNGEVVRITRDSIVFRERVMDKLGREVKRDVVKTLPGPKPA